LLTQEKIQNAVQTIAPQYGIDKVYLFGSYARGDATEESDVDFRIVEGEKITLLDIGGLYEDFIEALESRIDIVMTDNMSATFYDFIKNEEKLIYAKI